MFFIVTSRILCRKYREAPQSEEVGICVEGYSLNSETLRRTQVMRDSLRKRIYIIPTGVNVKGEKYNKSGISYFCICDSEM